MMLAEYRRAQSVISDELGLDPGAELSVRTDRVSIEYRRWLRELATAALAGPDAYAAALGERPVRGPTQPAGCTSGAPRST